MMPAIDTIIVSCSSDTGLIIIEGKLKASEHRTINLKDDSRFKLKVEIVSHHLVKAAILQSIIQKGNIFYTHAIQGVYEG